MVSETSEISPWLTRTHILLGMGSNCVQMYLPPLSLPACVQVSIQKLIFYSE